MAKQSDQELIDGVLAGDREAMRQLLGRCGPAVSDTIRREIGKTWQSLLDADDVMQVSYLEAFLQQDGIKAQTPAAFEAWLRKIAMNNLRDAVKELGRQKRPHPARRVVATAGAQDDSYVSLIHTLSDGGSTPSRAVARDEAAAAIEKVLQRLPDDYAQVIRLYDLEALPATEVAGRMQRSAGAIHMLRARAHDRMKRLIGGETDFFSQTA